MFSETKDAEFLNYICNHPDVRAGGDKDLDVSALLDRGISYSYENGAIIYAFKEPGIYEAHTQALKAGRGKMLREFIAWTLEDMFKNKGAEMITSFADLENIPAQKLAEVFLKKIHADSNSCYYSIDKAEFYANR